MVTAWVSIAGLYEYDNTILDGLINALPTPNKMPNNSDLYITGDTIDSSALINMIMYDCCELEFAIPHTAVAKTLITSWAETQRAIWQHLYNTQYYKYNPIWNKDGTKEHKETGSTNKSGNNQKNTIGSGSSDSTKVTTPNITRTSTNNSDGSSIHSVMGYNSGTLQTDYSDSGSKAITGSDTTTGTNTETNNTVKNDTGSETGSFTETGNDNRTITDTEHGNIGVTTTQAMISEEREIALFNIYDYIVKGFKNRFCLLVY